MGADNSSSQIGQEEKHMKRKYVGIIRNLVCSTGLSISDLAFEIGTCPQSIYKWLKGTSLPNCEHILELLDLIQSKSEEA